MQPVKINAVIYQGATFRLSLDRVTYPYAVYVDQNGVIRKRDGTEAPETDRVFEDYVGSDARAQIRQSIDSPDLIASLTVESGGIVLGGNRLSIYISATETAEMAGWETAICHVEVIRANGDVERQYEITFRLDKEVTR